MPSLVSRTTLGASLAASAFMGLVFLPAMASSHREAPYITRQPKVDAADFYMFRSTEANRAGFTTLIANYGPLQDAFGGPNYFSMDPDALYEIHIDNNGDAKEDLTFQFRFKNENRDTQLTVGEMKVSIPLVINGGVIGGDTAGFPNGRRLGDDVVDIALRMVMGRLCHVNLGCVPADAKAGLLNFTDGAYVDSSMFDSAFPYLKAPLPGSP